MDTTVIVVLVLAVLFIAGGLALGHKASKASAEAQKEELSKQKNK